MEIGYAVLGAFVGLIVGYTITYFWKVEPARKWRDKYMHYMGEWRTLALQNKDALQESIGLTEKAMQQRDSVHVELLSRWRDCLVDLVATTGKFERADEERRALRSRLAAALWSNRNTVRQLKASRKTAAFWQGKCAAMEYVGGFVCPAPLTEADKQWGIEAARGLGCTIDDNVEWRIRNIEEQLRAQEGEL